MMNFRHTLSISLSVSLAAVALAACQPAMLQGQSADSPTAVVQAQSPQILAAGTLNGMVAKFENGKFVPVENAEVKVEGTSAIAHTDGEGRYTISGVAPGSYNVSASKDGWVSGKHEIYMNAVMGTPRVNLALNPTERALQAVPPAVAVTVSGVVTDPRGSALGGATVKVLSNAGNNPGAAAGSGFNQQATADAAGFYTISIPGVAVSPTQPGQVQVTAWGTSPGGLKLETTDVYAYNLTTATLVANPQCKAFVQPGVPTWPNGSFGKEGTTTTIKADWLSSRSDEFYIELDCPAAGGSGKIDQVYGVLPEGAITINPATATLPPNGVATMRIPFTMPGNVFVARIIPFGLTSQFGKTSSIATARKSGPFVTNYVLGAVGTVGTFEDDVYFTGAATLSDNTDAVGLLNAGKLVSADTVNMQVNIWNRSTSVSQDLQISGTAPVGTTALTATYVPTPGGGPAQPAVTIPAGNITITPASGAFTVSGINMPLANPTAAHGSSTTNGLAQVTLSFSSPILATPTFQVTGMSVKMVSANLTKTAEVPGAAGNSTTLAGSDIDINQITMGPKTFQDDGSTNGIGFVKWTVTPVGATAGGVIRVTDRTMTDSPVGSAATITGTATMPAAGTTMGFTNGDHIDFASELGPNSVTILSNWDLETLCAFINATSTGIGVRAVRDASSHFQLVRTVAGTTKKLEIDNTSSASVATKLGVTLVAPNAFPAIGTDGALADTTGSGATRTTGGVGGNPYTIGNFSSVQNPDKSVTATFTLTPPATLGGTSTLATPIDVIYRIIQGSGTPGSNVIHLGGGGAAPFGASITAVNTSQVPTNTANDQAVTAAGAKAADAALSGIAF